MQYAGPPDGTNIGKGCFPFIRKAMKEGNTLPDADYCKKRQLHEEFRTQNPFLSRHKNDKYQLDKICKAYLGICKVSDPIFNIANTYNDGKVDQTIGFIYG